MLLPPTSRIASDAADSPMTFLNVLLLGGLAAVSIPIIIHLLHKSRVRVVRWGAMHLLETVINTNRRRINLEQLILLLVRASIPLILALCMARPVLTGLRTLLGDARSSTVLLLDNSYSMEAGAGRSNMARAKEEAGQIIASLQRGSQTSAVLMGEGVSLLDEPTFDPARVKEAIDNLGAGYGAATVPAALDVARGIFGRMDHTVRNAIILTDFQRVSWPTEDAARAEVVTRLQRMPVPPRLTLMNIGAAVQDNVAIESLEFPRFVVGVKQKVQVRANLRNFGDTPYPDLRVYLKTDGNERSVSQISLGPREHAQVLFSHAFEVAGSHLIEVFADADALKADNVHTASIPVRDKLPVLLVNGDPQPEPLRGETDFAEAALQPYDAGEVELADLISTRVIRAEELEAKSMRGSEVIIMANVRSLQDQQLRDLEDFVRDGGGLLIFPGDRVEMGWYNSQFHQEERGLLPLPLDAVVGKTKEEARTVAIIAESFTHPALELFNDPRNGNLADASIRTWFKSGQKEAGAVLARLDSGDPFLVEKKFGEGSVIQCSVACDGDWSNLPVRPFYLPLLQRLTVYLASTVFPPRNLEVNKPIVAFLPVSDAGKRVILNDPTGASIELPIVKQGERGVVEYGQTQRPGLYLINAPDGSPIHYVVNTSRRESNLEKLTDPEIATIGKEMGAQVINTFAEFEEVENTRRYGRELWRILLWVILALIFFELFLEQRFARARRAPA